MDADQVNPLKPRLLGHSLLSHQSRITALCQNIPCLEDELARFSDDADHLTVAPVSLSSLDSVVLRQSRGDMTSLACDRPNSVEYPLGVVTPRMATQHLFSRPSAQFSTKPGAGD